MVRFMILHLHHGTTFIEWQLISFQPVYFSFLTATEITVHYALGFPSIISIARLYTKIIWTDIFPSFNVKTRQ